MFKEIETNNETEIRAKAMDMLMCADFSKHPHLAFACIGGSSSNNSHGSKSDIDVLTIMNPDTPNKVNVDQMIDIATNLRQIGIKLASEHLDAQPVFISTIRLEEAQIALGGVSGKRVLPIHWLHYPSLEFAKINEPPELILGLLTGNPIKGSVKEMEQKFNDSLVLKELSGLDWLTDSLRILLTNAGKEGEQAFQPVDFLKGHAMHNLDYFWKWRVMAPIFEQKTSVKFKGWNDVEAISTSVPVDMLRICARIREVRHLGGEANINEIIALHKTTFELWPILI